MVPPLPLLLLLAVVGQSPVPASARMVFGKRLQLPLNAAPTERPHRTFGRYVATSKMEPPRTAAAATAPSVRRLTLLRLNTKPTPKSPRILNAFTVSLEPRTRFTTLPYSLPPFKPPTAPRHYPAERHELTPRTSTLARLSDVVLYRNHVHDDVHRKKKKSIYRKWENGKGVLKSDFVKNANGILDVDRGDTRRRLRRSRPRDIVDATLAPRVRYTDAPTRRTTTTTATEWLTPNATEWLTSYTTTSLSEVTLRFTTIADRRVPTESSADEPTSMSTQDILLALLHRAYGIDPSAADQTQSTAESSPPPLDLARRRYSHMSLPPHAGQERPRYTRGLTPSSSATTKLWTRPKATDWIVTHIVEHPHRFTTIHEERLNASTEAARLSSNATKAEAHPHDNHTTHEVDPHHKVRCADCFNSTALSNGSVPLNCSCSDDATHQPANLSTTAASNETTTPQPQSSSSETSTAVQTSHSEFSPTSPSYCFNPTSTPRPSKTTLSRRAKIALAARSYLASLWALRMQLDALDLLARLRRMRDY